MKIKNISKLLVLSLVFISCKVGSNPETEKVVSPEAKTQEIITNAYELDKPSSNTKAILILFGGYGETAEGIKNEFNIQEAAEENNVAVLFMNYNRKLWMEESDKDSLAIQLQNIFQENDLAAENVYLGGLSSGGDVAMLTSNYLVENNKYNLTPKGVFIVDSPIDLSALYHSAEVNVENDFSEDTVAESAWLIETFEEKFGKPQDDISVYEKYSVATLRTGNIQNIEALKDTKIRFYTEPDTTWWKENTMAEYETLNAYHIKKLSEALKKQGFSKVEYIATKDKGYRANGERNPHLVYSRS